MSWRPPNSILSFKKITVIFWTVWLAIMLWTDVIGGLAQLGWLHRAWAPNTNYPFLVASLAMYSPPAWLPAVFYGGIMLWELLATWLFLRASLALLCKKPLHIWLAYATHAYIFSILLWFAFFIADQLVMKFDLEANHMVQGGMMLLTFLALYLLPHEENIAIPLEK